MSVVRFTEPAKRWEEALPLGNGRIGAMMFGNIGSEQIQLNEDSVWYGGYMERNNPDAKKYLQELREAILSGKTDWARELANHAMMSTPQSMHPYQSLGELTMHGNYGEATDYVRVLDLSTAVHTVTYKIGGYQYIREQFISAPDQVLVMRYRTDAPEGLNITPIMTRSRYYDYAGKASDDTVMIGGNLGKGGSDFCMMLKTRVTGGSFEIMGERPMVRGANEAVFFLTAGTTYRESRLQKALLETLQKASEKTYEELLSRHIEDYQALYDRMELKLSSSTGADTEFTERYFNFGRYLMICSSRPGTLPITLQGLWNKDYLPAWDSKYTININTEMNYWPVESCNLPECHLPLFDLLEKMAVHGAVTADKMYGCKGIVAHHNTDMWGDTAVQDIYEPASLWVLGAAWLCTHQWMHYIYTKDTEFLWKAYPIMREAAHFFVDFLIEDKGYLKTCPSVSPENTYILPDGKTACLTAGATMDNQIIRDLMTQCLKAADILGIEEPLRADFENILKKLPPNQIGKYGQLMEWSEDYEEAESGHRHISHLYGLHPSHQITPDGTPELAKAAEITLQRRLANGGGHTGWSRAWIINMYCRLGDGENAYQNLLELFRKSTLPNLFDNHPPFQIDGNFGAIAGITEMLVQSSEERTLLLPALPKAWDSGSVRGLRVVGGGILNLSWKDGNLEYFELTAEKDLEITLVYQGNKQKYKLCAGETRRETGI